ncbi:ARM repeat-containing protein, partial [Aureobasidium melanogenum]
MSQSRQEAFQRLRPLCVELSSTALRFKADQASVKAVLLALEPVHDVLQSLGSQDLLDERLAEYAFFPLTHIFNQSRRLSPHVLEVAVRCVETLVSRGWRDRLLPEMARQLLILMGLLVSQDPKGQQEPATDELKTASFDCIRAIIVQVGRSGSKILDEVGDKNIVDQLVYQLLQALTESISEDVQISAAHALVELTSAITNFAVLASLLPRTVSTLVKVLRPSTQARRTRRVLVAYLELLKLILGKTLSDEVVNENVDEGSKETAKPSDQQPQSILDKSWLDATTPQVDIALVQVVKLRTHEGADVAHALLDLCVLIVEDCSRTLARSAPLMVETIVVLCRLADSTRANAVLRHLLTSRPDIADILSGKFYDWALALPRVMQGHDDRPKQQMLGQVATSFVALAESWNATDELSSRIAATLVDSVSAAIGPTESKTKLVNEAPSESLFDLVEGPNRPGAEFKPIILSHQSQQSSTKELLKFVGMLKSQTFSQGVTRSIINQTLDPNVNRRLAATWLALAFLRSPSQDTIDIDDFIQDNASQSDMQLSRPFLVSDLYALTLPNLLQYADAKTEGTADWRLVAMSLESLTLQASQLGRSYRIELMETLFPVLTLFGDENAILQQHAVTALNLLATAFNAVALCLNAFDVSPDSLQVIAMMMKLCGARLLPHLDDLIGSMFGALDNFHGYPSLVEHLFAVLKMMVEQSSKTPEVLAIKSNKGPDTDGAIGERKTRSDEDHEAITAAPHRPWTKAEDGLGDDGAAQSLDAEDDAENDRPLEHTNGDKEPALSKSHQLLLNIAQSAVPHMSSPSPKVRLTLLQLLEEVCPLLARDENSFLPLVNTVWPAITPRLLIKDEQSSYDMPYTVQAAADTISTMCRAAGSFMTSRIEEIFGELEALFRRVYSTATSTKTARQKSASANSTLDGLGSRAFLDVRNLQQQTTVESGSSFAFNQDDGAVPASTRRILDSLVALFITILRYVRISEDNADKVFALLSPLMDKPGKGEIKAALKEYNEDAVWLFDQYGVV